MDITDLLVLATRNKASDLHISSNQPPLLRINGDIANQSLPITAPPQVKDMIYSIMSEQQRSIYEREMEIDFAISFGTNMRFRVNAFNTIHGPAAVFRNIPSVIRTLDELGAPAILKNLAELRNGMIIVTGPTGSGKTTTLAAVVDHINSEFPKHILTVEDPIEIVHASKQSLVNQREIGKSTMNFARALKSALREDPDVILVGEMRDLETIQLALSAAETGHLVLGTMHTNSAPDSVDRIIDVFPAEGKEMVRTMLSNALQAVVAQTLIKKVGGGRVAAYEIMVGTPAIRNLIREGKVPQLYSMIQMGSRYGMGTMRDSIQGLVESGAVDPTIAAEVITSMSKDGAPLDKQAVAAQAAKKAGEAAAQAQAAPQPAKQTNSGSNVF